MKIRLPLLESGMGAVSFYREILAYDLFYIKNVSFGLDLYIMFATVKILLLGRGGR